MKLSRQIRFFSVLAALVLSGQAGGAQASSPPDLSTFHRAPQLDPNELERALQSQNPDDAKRALGRGSSCSPNDAAAEVVRQAWQLRDSAGASGAVKDSVVRTLMAKCLAEYKPRFTALEPADAPVLAQLRLALESNDPEQVRAAADGLTQTATQEDVQAMVNAAARLPALQPLITGALGQVCRVDAIAAAATIKSIATEERRRGEIENAVAYSAKMRRVWCGYDANIVPNDVSQADIDDFLNPGYSERVRDIGDLKNILGGTNLHAASEAFIKLRCGHEDEKTLRVVKQAWAERNYGAANLVTRDSGVRLMLAKCIVYARSPTSKEKVPAAVKEQLREAVRDSNDFHFVLGVGGLARIANLEDIRLIEESVKGRNSVIADAVVQYLTGSCAPGAQEAVAEIRRNTTRPKAARDMDYAVGVTRRVREFVCSAKP